eukprot:gene11564-13497_t
MIAIRSFVLLLLLVVTLNDNSRTEALTEVKFAVIQSGPPDDLGFNYMINNGRIEAETALNITTTIGIFDVITPKQATETIHKLVAQGYNLIFASSLTHGNAAINASYIYPDVKFIVRGRGNSSLPNVGRVSYDIGSADYMAGYFAGMSTKSHKVGVVIPGLKDKTYHHANSFTTGARTAAALRNVTLEVYVMSTGFYLNSDYSTIAATEVVSRGADVISQIQDDMTVSVVAMRSGAIGIGTNGFPQRQVYGEKIGTSYIINWGVLFIESCLMVRNENWTVGWNYLGNFNNTVLSLDEFSYKVPADTSAIIREEENRFKLDSSYTPEYCYPDNCLIFNCTAGCVSYFDWIGSTKLLPGIIDLGNVYIPLTPVTLSKGVENTFLALGGVLLALSAISIVAVIVLRRTKSIRSASPLFCVVILLGGAMIFIGVIVWVSTPTQSLCLLRYWIVSLGYTIMLGNMVVKNVRIYLLFSNKKLVLLKITNSKLMPYVAAILLVNIGILVAWTVVGKMDMYESRNIDDIGKYEFIRTCEATSAGNVILYVLLGYHALMIIVGCYVSFKLRSVEIDEYNESRSIASILYAIAFCLFIVIPLLVSSQGVHSQITIICASFIFTAASGLLILFVPKFYRIASQGLQINTPMGITSNIDAMTMFHDELDEEVVEKGPTPGAPSIPAVNPALTFTSSDDSDDEKCNNSIPIG